MNGNLILTGLNHNNERGVLERMAKILGSVPGIESWNCLVLGETGDAEEIRTFAKAAGVSRLCLAEYQDPKADTVAAAEAFLSSAEAFLSSAEAFLSSAEPSECTLLCGTEQGKELGKALAARMQLACCSDTEALERKDGILYAVRPVFSTHCEGLFPAADALLIISLNGPGQTYAGAAETEISEEHVPVKQEETVVSEIHVPVKQKEESSYRLISKEALDQPEDLSQANFVLIGGKGLGSKANFEKLEALGKQIGASVGCSRLAALSGYTDFGKVVGVSGWHLRAKVCITFGVSGAGPLLHGLKDVGRLVAVNTDRSAPIFRYADYGIEADCMQIIQTLTETAAWERKD